MERQTEDSESSVRLFELESEDEMHHAGRGPIIFEAVADSGCTEHIVSRQDIKGIKIEPSKASVAGRGFTTATGDRVPNEGECPLSFSVGEKGLDVSGKFQVAQVTRPLMSIGKICDKGNTMTFTKDKGIVNGPDGSQICVFERDRGLYVAKVRVKRDEASFRRQGA